MAHQVKAIKLFFAGDLKQTIKLFFCFHIQVDSK
jgi:hypothetical protein